MDDAIRGGIIREEEIPRTYTDILGHSSKERLNTMIHDIVAQSQGNLPLPCQRMWNLLSGVCADMFDNVYTNPKAKGEERKAENTVKELFLYYMDHPELLPMNILRECGSPERHRNEVSAIILQE